MEMNGVVPLSTFEIEKVSGGKSAVGNFWESLSGWFDGMSGPPDPFSMTINSRELADLMSYVSDRGGTLLQSGSLAAGTLNIMLTSADGTFTFIGVTGVRR